MAEAKKRAPTLYAIIGIKLLKGLFFILLAAGVFSLIGQDLPAEFQKLLRWMNLDPERELFFHLEQSLAKVTPANIRWVASGALLYSLLSLGEAIGLMLRVRWVGWLVAMESALLIPFEIYKITHHFTWFILGVLALNVFIVCYLILNRNRLFKHHMH